MRGTAVAFAVAAALVAGCADKVDPNSDPGVWVQYLSGDAPLIIIAPHGGSLAPRGLRTRRCSACIASIDENTQELARLVADSFAVRTGRRPHLVLNLLYRGKFDANRGLEEATDGNVALEPTWRWFHGAIDAAKAAAVRSTGRGLVIDLHGHDHAVPRIEVGYMLDASTFRLADDAITAASPALGSSIGSIARNSPAGDSFVAMHNGPNSLGGMLEAAGLPAVPSPSDRAPKEREEYFTGGYNTLRHGSARGGAVDAIQIELPLDTMRDTSEHFHRVAGILATVLAQYLERHYGWK